MRVLVAVLMLLVASCGDPEAKAGGAGANKSAASVRAVRRAYDGAPPVIPHDSFGATCTSCHNERGMDVPDVGFAPPSPHEQTGGMSALSRCEQCHVFQATDSLFVESSFDGFPQDLRTGTRAYDGAPPVMPHGAFMRENCQACHAGPAAREEIRNPHPERTNCRQCHVEHRVASIFER